MRSRQPGLRPVKLERRPWIPSDGSISAISPCVKRGVHRGRVAVAPQVEPTRGLDECRRTWEAAPLVVIVVAIDDDFVDGIGRVDHGVVEALGIAEGAGVAIVEFVHGDGWGKPRVVG